MPARASNAELTVVSRAARDIRGFLGRRDFLTGLFRDLPGVSQGGLGRLAGGVRRCHISRHVVRQRPAIKIRQTAWDDGGTMKLVASLFAALVVLLTAQTASAQSS